VETLTARKHEIAGLGLVFDERIEAYVLYVKHEEATEIVSVRSRVEDGGAGLKPLLSGLRAQGLEKFEFPKVHPSEVAQELLETLGFRSVRAHRLYAASARS
jgi:hypothetical protein